jgi:hypothetical protein
VEQGYVDGKPLHHLPSARDREWAQGQSRIFVVEYDEYSRMSTQEVQRIFRDRHILVINQPDRENGEFGLKALSMLGHLDADLEMQGEKELAHCSLFSYDS